MHLAPWPVRWVLAGAALAVFVVVMVPIGLLAWRNRMPNLAPGAFIGHLPWVALGVCSGVCAGVGIWQAGSFARRTVLLSAVLMLGLAWPHEERALVAAMWSSGLACLLSIGRLNWIDPREVEAAGACGARPDQALRLVVLPALVWPVGVALFISIVWLVGHSLDT